MSGEYAVEFVRGMEQNPDDPGHIQASACCKHYAANSMEHTTEGGQTHTRHDFDANITMQDLVDSYLAPFQACVEKGRVSGLMCSYNAINGVPTCADPWLLQEVARDTWGFDGYITSDCGAESDVFVNHHFTATPEEAVQKILQAGTDSDCGEFFGKHAESALDKGLITEADMDTRLAMLFRVRMRLAHFDPPGPLQQIPPSVICSDAAKATARDAVAQAVALVKNAGATLPFDPTKVKTAAVIGPNAKQPWDITSYYGPSSSCDEGFYTMVDAVQQYVNATTYVAGLDATLSTNRSGIPAAAAAAKGKDVVVLVLGTDLTSAHEEMDATNVSVPAAQLALVDAVTAAATVPVVVVMLTAVPLDISAILANPKVGAVLHAGQPSVQTLGIGDVLFGKKPPAGRLIQTVYPESYAAEVSIFDFNMRPGPSAFPRPDCPDADAKAGTCKLGTNPGRTYRFYTGKPVLPFGFGLSYTTFEYAVASAPNRLDLTAARAATRTQRHGFVSAAAAAGKDSTAGFVVNVTNTGQVASDDVVLGFAAPPGSGQNGAPIKTLFGFERVFLKPGETKSVELYPELTLFAPVGPDGVREVREGQWIVSFGVPETREGGMGYAEHTFEAF